ncbi:unnamed protein product [Lactuca saligna]|uniref:Myb/SANT-like domain-containing protein n=1 Tax=Lactuca saligna TaxID=75948 RepID=A0AA36E3W6_LACSI|nr:unnamed protein product [Lactuca saligna]
MNKRAADGSVVKKENLTWTDHMDNVLVEALVKEDQICNRVNGTFTSQAYANMIARMSKEFNKSVTKDQLKNKMKFLKGNFSKWYDMYWGTSLSGFSWNSQTKYIEAEEEVWEQLINEVILENEYKDDDEDIHIVFATDVLPNGSSQAKKLKSKKKKKLERKLQDEDEVVAEPQPQPQP